MQLHSELGQLGGETRVSMRSPSYASHHRRHLLIQIWLPALHTGSCIQNLCTNLSRAQCPIPVPLIAVTRHLSAIHVSPISLPLIACPHTGYPTMTSPAFSLKFNTMPCDHMLFATGDMRRWLSAEKAVVQGWYANGARPIIKSSASSATSKARWYRRESNKEDPWISITDHHTAIGAGDIVYGEKGFGGTHASTVLPGHAGANVFCKVVDPEDVCYVKSHTEKRCMNYKINGQWQRTFTKAASVQDCANLCKSKGNCNMFSFGSPEQPAGEVGSCLFAVAGCRLEGGGHARGYNTYTPQDCSSASDMQLEEGVFAEVAMINQQLKDAGVADVDAGVQAL